MPASAGDLAALHSILVSPIVAFIPFLILKYHKADASPFENEITKIIILAFYVATLTYVAAMVTEFKLRIHEVECPKIISNISHLSAPLASISLVMITFPYLGRCLLFIWIVCFVKLALDSYQEFFQLLGDLWNKLWRRETKKEENIYDPKSISDAARASDSPV